MIYIDIMNEKAETILTTTDCPLPLGAGPGQSQRRAGRAAARTTEMRQTP